MRPGACVKQSKRAKRRPVGTLKPLLHGEKYVIRFLSSLQPKMKILQRHRPDRRRVVVLGPLNAAQGRDAGETPLSDCMYRSIPGRDKSRTTRRFLVEPDPMVRIQPGAPSPLQ